MRRLEKFWDLFYTHNAGSLIQYEKFINDPKEVAYDVFEDYNLEWIMWETDEPPKIRLPLKLDINYEKKFKNIEEIRKWFND